MLVSELLTDSLVSLEKKQVKQLLTTFLRLQINGKMVSPTLYSKSSQLILSMFPFLSTVYEHPVHVKHKEEL